MAAMQSAWCSGGDAGAPGAAIAAGGGVSCCCWCLVLLVLVAVLAPLARWAAAGAGQLVNAVLGVCWRAIYRLYILGIVCRLDIYS